MGVAQVASLQRLKADRETTAGTGPQRPEHFLERSERFPLPCCLFDVLCNVSKMVWSVYAFDSLCDEAKLLLVCATQVSK